MGRRTIAILIFVVGILILSAVVVYIFVLQPTEVTPAAGEEGVPEGVEGEVGPAAVVSEPTMPPTVGVYVSLQTVPRGFQYPQTEAELEGLVVVDQRIASEVDDGLVTDVEGILGLYARNDIFQGESLTKDALVDDPTLIGIEDYGPSSLIPPGSIALAIPMDRLNSVAYALDEGDHIDIMITFNFLQIDEEFQTYLQNSGLFLLEGSFAAESEGAESGAAQPTNAEVFIISPYGRFEGLPTGDLAHIAPSEAQRPIPVSMILQNAKVIQVGAWKPPALAQPPTPVPTPVEEGAEITPTPFAQVTPIPEPPDVLVVALSPQQQLLVKYAVESYADIDFALRGANDGQIYTVENVDLDFILQRFGIGEPLDFGYTVDIPTPPDATPTPAPEGTEGGNVPEGG